MSHQAPYPTYGHEVLAVVFQVRGDDLCLLLWRRTENPCADTWALPGGAVGPDETLEQSVRRHLAAKVDVREMSYLEQLRTVSDPLRHPGPRLLATAYLGLVPSDLDPVLPADTAWHPVGGTPATAFDHGALAIAGRDRLRAKLSYTNLGYALAPPQFTIAELRAVYVAALGHDVSATNLRRVLLRRAVLEPTGEIVQPDSAGGRPPARFRFRDRGYRVTDPAAVLRPPQSRS